MSGPFVSTRAAFTLKIEYQYYNMHVSVKEICKNSKKKQLDDKNAAQTLPFILKKGIRLSQYSIIQRITTCTTLLQRYSKQH